MSEFMTDDDLEALKEETNADEANDSQAIASANGIPQPHAGSSGQQPSDSSLLTKFFGQAASGTAVKSSTCPHQDNCIICVISTLLQHSYGMCCILLRVRIDCGKLQHTSDETV